MKDISNIDAVIEDLKSYNANDHTKLAPSNVTEYSRQVA